MLNNRSQNMTEVDGVSMQQCGICKERVKENQIFGFKKCDHILVLCKKCEKQLNSCPFRCENSIKRRLILRELV